MGNVLRAYPLSFPAVQKQAAACQFHVSFRLEHAHGRAGLWVFHFQLVPSSARPLFPGAFQHQRWRFFLFRPASAWRLWPQDVGDLFCEAKSPRIRLLGCESRYLRTSPELVPLFFVLCLGSPLFSTITKKKKPFFAGVLVSSKRSGGFWRGRSS